MKSVLLYIIVIFPLVAWANNAVTPAQVDALKERIARLSAEQNKDLRQRDSLQAQLRDHELAINQLQQQRHALTSDIQDSEQRLSSLQQQQAQLARQQHQQLDLLARTVRASYINGQQNRLKLLLNQQSPDSVARLMRYHDYVQRARNTRLIELREELTALQAVGEQIRSTRAQLTQQQQELGQQQQRLERANATRAATLADIQRTMADRESTLSSLKADQERLQKLLDDMARSLADIPADMDERPFASMEGKLPWPLNGRIINAFNSQREGAMRWQGVVKQAQPGTSVRAIHPGRVVFSDWLRGYGLLIIVDHGSGYLSLYGYNQTLLRNVGDWVNTGDAISEVGRSGGNDQSGLYFEIRHRGTAQNPGRWSNHRVTMPAR